LRRHAVAVNVDPFEQRVQPGIGDFVADEFAVFVGVEREKAGKKVVDGRLGPTAGSARTAESGRSTRSSGRSGAAGAFVGRRSGRLGDCDGFQQEKGEGCDQERARR
jgi:hypothetical protein